MVSIVEQFFLQSMNLLEELGYIGILLGLMVEVIPSELVLAYGGYLVSVGKIQFIGAICFGIIGGVLAQIFLYLLGYFGGRKIVLKFGKYIGIHERHLYLAEIWFEKYGAGVVFFARFIPIVRHAISLPAGFAKMSFWRFCFYTWIAVIPWTFFFLFLGLKLGANWQLVKTVAEPYVEPIMIGAITVVALYLTYSLQKKTH